MDGVLLLSGRVYALVVPGIAGRKFPARDECEPSADVVRYRGQFPPPGFNRKTACAKSAAVVWRNDRILGWHDAGHLDGECSRLDDLAFDVRVQRQSGNNRNVFACL